MSMFGFVSPDTRIVLGVFLKVVKLRVFYDAPYSDRLTDMV